MPLKTRAASGPPQFENIVAEYLPARCIRILMTGGGRELPAEVYASKPNFFEALVTYGAAICEGFPVPVSAPTFKEVFKDLCHLLSRKISVIRAHCLPN